MTEVKNTQISDERAPRETLWEFIERKSAQKSSLGRQETARHYLSFGRSLQHYFSDARPALYLEDIDGQFVRDYGLHLKRLGLGLSTISFYNRIFRSLYNQAVREGLVRNAHPFDDAYTKVTAVRRYSRVTTLEGDAVLDSLSKEDIISRYMILTMKYNALIDRMSGVAEG